MGESTIVDDVTRIRCQQNLVKFLVVLDDFLYGSDRDLEQLQISFVHCSSESHFLSAGSLVEKSCVYLKFDVFHFYHIVYHIWRHED